MKENIFITTDKEVPSYQKRMSICLCADGFSFAIITDAGLLHTFGSVQLQAEESLSETANVIKCYFLGHNMQPYDFKEMELVVRTSHSVWIPDHLYSDDKDSQYLSLLESLRMGTSLFKDHNTLINAHLVFTADHPLITAFRIALPSIKVRCQHSKFVNDVLLSSHSPVVVMNVCDQEADFNVCREGQLLLSNTYTCANNEELLYRALCVMKELNLETPDMELRICGDVDRGTYAALVNYFPNVSLYCGRPLSFENPVFQQLHTYHDAVILS